MVRALLLILGAIPAIGAVLIVYPMLAGESTFSSPIESSKSSSGPLSVQSKDSLRIEYSKQYLRPSTSSPLDEISRLQAHRTEMLIIDEDGTLQYTETQNGVVQTEKDGQISDDKFKKIKAMIKETGFTKIQEGSFPVKDDADNYTKYTINLQLNNERTRINWPEQNASDKLVPPIVTRVQEELDSVIKGIIN